MAEEKLVPTGDAAKSLGISSRTLQRYVQEGLIKPELVLPHGQYRWLVSKLREQIKALGDVEPG